MFELSIKSDFAASHEIRNHPGKCKRLHGHTWKVEIVISAQMLDKIGMVIDFSEIKNKLKNFISQLDHSHLNDLPFFAENNPTAENIAKFIYDGFSKECLPYKLARVVVWESDRTSVTHYKG